MDSLSAIFDKAVVYSTLNSAKYVVTTILHIPTHPSKDKHPLIITDITGTLSFRSPKLKLINVWDVDILFKYFERSGDNTLFTNRMLTQNLITANTTDNAQALHHLHVCC